MKSLLLAALTAAVLVLPVEAAQMTKEQCLGCHGPFESLRAKNIQAEADPAPVNPHIYIPHTDKGGMDKIWECTMCHTPHAMPPKKDPNREPANVEACYQCHHQYNFKRCDECHGGNK